MIIKTQGVDAGLGEGEERVLALDKDTAVQRQLSGGATSSGYAAPGALRNQAILHHSNSENKTG